MPSILSGDQPVYTHLLGSPAVAGGTALAATATAAASTVSSGITQPDAARNVVCTPGGTTANVVAVSVIVNGTDVSGAAISETLPAFTAGQATAVTGVKAFATITSIVFPIVGAATTVATTFGGKLGLLHANARDTILAAFLNGVREATRPTVTVSAASLANNTVTLNSALAGTPVIIDAYDTY